jgi:hypothetical protein
VSDGGVQPTKRPWFEGRAVTAVGAATAVVTTGSSGDREKERAFPSWVRNAQRVVDPAVKFPQATVVPPAADWKIWLLVNAAWAA